MKKGPLPGPSLSLPWKAVAVSAIITNPYPDVTSDRPDLRKTGFWRDACGRCRSPRSFHGTGGRCKALGCTCPAWVESPDGPADPVNDAPCPPRAAATAARPPAWTGAPIPAPRAATPSPHQRQRLGGPPHVVEPHVSWRFVPGCHGAQGLCSFVRYCGLRAVWDSYDELGRRRALCRGHLLRSAAFGSPSW